MNLYRNESSQAKYNAQRNLQGRTHYVDDATLKFHKSRILHTCITDNGLLFALVESCAATYDNTERGFRGVIFDVFGNVISRPELGSMSRTRKAAEKAMWQTLNSIDAKKVTLEAIDRIERNHRLEMAELRDKIAKLGEKAA